MSGRVHSVCLRSSGFTLPMEGWCEEKAHWMVADLAVGAEYLRRYGTGPMREEQLAAIIGAALHNALKVLSFVIGSDWDHFDRDLIMKDGLNGYVTVCERYGLTPLVLPPAVEVLP